MAAEQQVKSIPEYIAAFTGLSSETAGYVALCFTVALPVWGFIYWFVKNLIGGENPTDKGRETVARFATRFGVRARYLYRATVSWLLESVARLAGRRAGRLHNVWRRLSRVLVGALAGMENGTAALAKRPV